MVKGKKREYNSLIFLIIGIVIGILIILSIYPVITGEAKGGPKVECSDHLDNDKDGFCDFPYRRAFCSDGSTLGDVGCVSKDDNDETNCGDGVCEGGETSSNCPQDCPLPQTQCNDLSDNDNDTLIDYPNDPGCSSNSDDTETSSALVCDNGIDETNDRDTLADFRLINGDPGCISATDSSEVDGQCDDFSDNDGDSYPDYNLDSKCVSTNDNDESPRDFCSDNDGGINPLLKGTVSGEDNSVPFSNTDFCISSILLREYYCGGRSSDYDPLAQDMNCTGNTTSCSNGACV